MEQTRRLIEVMARLRAPDGGCSWDLRQDFSTIAPYTIEEAYEVADAIARENVADLREELGDLLLQVAFHAQMAQEAGLFDFEAVAEGIVDKLIRRHPHVFGGVEFRDDAERAAAWEAAKAEERRDKQSAQSDTAGLLAGIALGLPALMRAEKLQRAAARGGFDWPDPGPVLDKVREEVQEVADEVASGDQAAQSEEVGDLLFAVVNLARHLKVDPESALRRANRKFERRFGHVERSLGARGQSPDEATLEEMEILWEEAKSSEKID